MTELPSRRRAHASYSVVRAFCGYAARDVPLGVSYEPASPRDFLRNVRAALATYAKSEEGYAEHAPDIWLSLMWACTDAVRARASSVVVDRLYNDHACAYDFGEAIFDEVLRGRS